MGIFCWFWSVAARQFFQPHATREMTMLIGSIADNPGSVPEAGSDQVPQTDEFVMPERPQDAIVLLTITVVEIAGEGLLLGTAMTPGSLVLDHQQTGKIFEEASIEPRPGVYVLANSLDKGLRVSRLPESVFSRDGDALVRILQGDLDKHLAVLVDAIRAFPTRETINEVAREVAMAVILDSLKRSTPFKTVWVQDPRKARIESVDCASCAIGARAILDKLVVALGIPVSGPRDATHTQVEGVKFRVGIHDGQCVVEIGFLDHDAPFARLFNEQLAERVRAAVEPVTESVVVEIRANNDVSTHMIECVERSLAQSFKVDEVAIALRATQIERAMETCDEASADFHSDEAIDPANEPSLDS